MRYVEKLIGRIPLFRRLGLELYGALFVYQSE